MITPENRTLLEGLRNTNYGKALKQLLDEKIVELNNVQNCKTWEETQGRAMAIKTLEEILYFMKEREAPKTKTRYD